MAGGAGALILGPNPLRLRWRIVGFCVLVTLICGSGLATGGPRILLGPYVASAVFAVYVTVFRIVHPALAVRLLRRVGAGPMTPRMFDTAFWRWYLFVPPGMTLAEHLSRRD